jgi:hypothetical protein
MPGVSEPLADHHRQCDALFAAAEDAAQRGAWPAYRARVAELRDALERRFEFEESSVFPVLEGASGLPAAPTEIMRREHAEMRSLLAALAAAAPERDPEGCRSELKALFGIFQRHNAREESVLYPACERILGPQASALANQVRRFAEPLAQDSPPEIDVRGLDPPEPMVRILERLQHAPDSPLRVRIHREPFPLYELLLEQGYRWRSRSLADGSFEILIERARP